MVDTFNVSDSAEVLRLAESGEIPASAEVASSTHRIFRLNVDGVDAACKVFRQQHGDEVEREWEGLTRMRDAGLDLAPTPLADGSPDVVVFRPTDRRSGRSSAAGAVRAIPNRARATFARRAIGTDDDPRQDRVRLGGARSTDNHLDLATR